LGNLGGVSRGDGAGEGTLQRSLTTAEQSETECRRHPRRGEHGESNRTNLHENSRGSKLAKSSMAKLWAVELLETTNHTNKHEKGRGAMQQAGAAFSNPFTSELARDC